MPERLPVRVCFVDSCSGAAAEALRSSTES